MAGGSGDDEGGLATRLASATKVPEVQEDIGMLRIEDEYKTLFAYQNGKGFRFELDCDHVALSDNHFSNLNLCIYTIILLGHIANPVFWQDISKQRSGF